MQIIGIWFMAETLVMKKILALFCLFILLSCANRNKTNSPGQSSVPEALQEGNENKSMRFKKRGAEDLLEELYEEKVKSTPVLQAIEAMIDKLTESHNDSLENYNDFNSKNLEYYNSAKRHVISIRDSLLEKEIKIVLERSISGYDNKIARLNNLVAILGRKPGSIADRHTALKILISLEMMEEYQLRNMPLAKPLEAIIKNYDHLIQKMDSVISKNK